MRRMIHVTAALLGFALVGVLPAQAHKVIASVFASGTDIEGEIGFSNGDMAANALVEIFDGDGARIGETRTDADGFFVFTPDRRVVHVFRANLGAGHVAEVRMELDELPEIAGAGMAAGGAAGAGDATVSTDAAPVSGQVAADASSGTPMLSQELLDRQREDIREMIHREVTPLRRELAAYKEKNDLQTILGGIGYIIGLFGLYFYIAARRRQAGS